MAKKKKDTGGVFPTRPPEHDEWSRLVKIRDSYTCQECGCLDRRKLHAHHIKSWTKYPHLRFEVDNGQTLCIKCHAKKHPTLKSFMLGKTRKKRKRVNRAIKALNTKKR